MTRPARVRPNRPVNDAAAEPIDRRARHADGWPGCRRLLAEPDDLTS